MRNRFAAFVFGMVISVNSAAGQESTLVFPPSVQIETGDAWVYRGGKYRLYGVQSCIRGTFSRAENGAQSDCGAQSMASLAALFLTGTISCQPVGTAKDLASFVVCAANIDGQPIDVGTALISSGVAFAATFPSGNPVSTPYVVAEMTAKANRSGLWAGQFQHPVRLLLQPK
jgi:endonuclease YncB( thermonuclease family)